MMATAHHARLPHGRMLAVALLGSPVAWVLHLLGTYLVVALWCAERWARMGLAIGLLTALCAAGALATGALALKLWRHGQRGLHYDDEPGVPEPWDARMGERGARAVFLAVIALFQCALFTYLIVLQGLPPAFAPACQAGTVP